MMRARHQRSLVAKQEDWLVKLRRFSTRRSRELGYPKAMKNALAAISDIGQLELGGPGANFAPAVVSAVEMKEEGVFRHIVMYL